MNPQQQPSSSPNVSRGIGAVLGVVVFFCMVLIAAAGYVKYQLDRAEGVLAAPGSAFVNDQEAFEKLRRTLGYSGFIGFAQSYVATHDANNLPDMRAQVKQAGDMITKLPDRTPPEMRHDLQAILAVFQNAVNKAEKDPSNFTAADMAPLYGALPVLDSRVDGAVAANRLEAQEKLQFWAMLLTLVAWCSLIIASATVAGIYLTLRGRNSAPLRALAQSVRNMGRGDMRTSIWGMERSDMIGELARAIDLARYHFSQLPDMSLLSEQGPVRLRFEGNTRSMFEAMIRVISRDSEQVRSQATALTDAVMKQQEAISLISSRVEAVLQNIEKRGIEGDQQARTTLQNIITSAQNLKAAQEHAADQLNRIVPYLQERAHGMAEITQITGKQVAQVLAALTLSERGLKASAEQSEGAIKKLTSAADDLGERMFGAVNLLQASGKVLAETTEKTQSRLNEAISIISGGTLPPVSTEPAASPMPDIMPRLDAIAAALEATQKKLDERPAVMSAAPAESSVVLDVSPRLEAVAVALESAQKKLDEQLHELVRDRIAGEQNTSSATQTGDKTAIAVGSLLLEIKAGFDSTARQIEAMREQMAVLPAGAAAPSGVTDQIKEQWYQMAGQIEATRAALEQTVIAQIDRIEARLGNIAQPSSGVDPAAFTASQQQMEQQTQILSELVATLGVLDTHMQQLKSEIGHHKASGM